jgi:sirohydrochlorin cobaltochelatase
VTQAVILFGHGARDPRWAEPFERLRQMLQSSLPNPDFLRLAYLELMTPNLLDAVTNLVENGAKRILVVPVFFGQGGHLRKDFPVLLEQCRQAFSGVDIQASSAVGEWDTVLSAIVQGVSQRVKVDAI